MFPIHFLHKGTIIASLEEFIPSLNLLAHAQMAEISVGSQCGGHGACGRDRLVISPNLQLRFFNQPTHLEEKHLSCTQILEGFRLACQCFPNVKQPDCEILIEVLSIQS